MNESIRQALERGFLRETQAYLKYLVYAQIAKEESKTAPEKEKSLLQDAWTIFRRVAEEEAGHAEYYLKAIGEIGQTHQNLQAAVEAEQADIVEYAMSAAAARTDGMEEVAKTFERISNMEKRHAQLYSDLLKQIQDLWLEDRLNSIDVPENKPE